MVGEGQFHDPRYAIEFCHFLLTKLYPQFFLDRKDDLDVLQRVPAWRVRARRIRSNGTLEHRLDNCKDRGFDLARIHCPSLSHDHSHAFGRDEV